MFNFKKAELRDIEELSATLDSYKGRICDYSAGNVVFWRNYYGISYHLDEKILILKYDSMGQRECYSYPLCDDPNAAIRELIRFVGGELCLSCLTKEELRDVKEHFEVTEVMNSEDYDDYLYTRDDLVSLKGRKYNGQRNHINKFKKLYENFRFERITSENASEAKDFCNRYFEALGNSTPYFLAEQKGLCELFDNWDKYFQLGGMLRVEDTVVGVSTGEIVGDTLIVHTEKADTSFEGSYPILMNCFAREFADPMRCLYINREEDCGVEGLRISKRAYHPIQMIKKYAAVIKGLS